MLPAYFLVWYLDVTIKKWGFPTLGSPGSSAGTKQLMTSYRNICMGAILPTVKEGCYQGCERASSDQGLRCMDKGRNEEAND